MTVDNVGTSSFNDRRFSIKIKINNKKIFSIDEIYRVLDEANDWDDYLRKEKKIIDKKFSSNHFRMR